MQRLGLAQDQLSGQAAEEDRGYWETYLTLRCQKTVISVSKRSNLF
jgi:hypothetical protein